MNDNVVKFELVRTKKLREQSTLCKSNTQKELIDAPAYNIIDVRWYTMGKDGIKRNEPIGVVLVEDWNQQDVWAAMGTGNNPQNIAAWGAHLSKEVAEAMFRYEIPDYKER